ncbi:MAG TPA: dihydrolipoamide acetyltransferase family protein [Gemmataceae bacterium]|nr:dihydrolipoamide acetyltransferase family protein [Gemmataceae bacterium]
MEFRLPELGEGVYEAELVSWLVKAGDAVKRGQSLMEVMTDKATMEVPSPFAGTVTTLEAKPGQQIKVGDVVLTYAGAEQAKAEMADGRKTDAATRRPGDTTKDQAVVPSRNSNRHDVAASPHSPIAVSQVRAAPSVRYMARKLGIDLAQVHGSGPGGRILIEDLSSIVAPAEAPQRPARGEARPDHGTPGTRVKLQGLRRIIADRMVQSKHTIPHYTYVDECDVSDLVRLRDTLRPRYELAGVKLTYLAFFVKAVTAALKEVPIVNASLDEKAGEIVLHDRYHIGIAVATSNGLMVPVVRDADRKDLTQVARDIERLGAEARTGKARLDDLRGSTFTVTSIGNIGGLFSTPVINHPEVGILGVGKVVKRPVYDAAGNLRPADMVYLSLSFDHRVVDGAVGAAFGNAVIRQLQSPAALLLPATLD